MAAKPKNKYAAKPKAEHNSGFVKGYIPEDMANEFKAIAKERGVSASSILSRLVETFIKGSKATEKQPEHIRDGESVTKAAQRRQQERNDQAEADKAEGKINQDFNGQVCPECTFGMHDVKWVDSTFPPKMEQTCSNCNHTSRYIP